MAEREQLIGTNPDGSRAVVNSGGPIPEVTVIPPDYMGKGYWQAKLSGRQESDGTVIPTQFPNGTRIYEGNQQFIIQEGQKIEMPYSK